MKRVVWAVGLIAIAAATVALVMRFITTDESERAVTGAPMERAEPQARAS